MSFVERIKSSNWILHPHLSIFFSLGILGRELAGQDIPDLPKAALIVSMVETLRCIFICFFWFLYFWSSELFFKSMEADLWSFKFVALFRSLSEFDAFLLIAIFSPLSHFWYIDGVQTTSSTGKSSRSCLVFFLYFFFFRFFLSFLFFLSSSLSVDEDEDFKGFIRLPRGMESSDDSLSDLGSSFLWLKTYHKGR